MIRIWRTVFRKNGTTFSSITPSKCHYSMVQPACCKHLEGYQEKGKNNSEESCSLDGDLVPFAKRNKTLARLKKSNSECRHFLTV